MTEHLKWKRRMTAASVLLISAGALYRIIRIFYSGVYSDVSYADSFVAFVYYASVSMLGIFYGISVSASSFFGYVYGRRGFLVLIPIAVSLFINYGGGFIYDLAVSSIRGLELAAAINILVQTFYGLCLCAAVIFIALRYKSRKLKGVSGLLIRSSLVILIAEFIVRTMELIADLIKYSFDITGAEIASLATEYIEIFLQSGVLVFVVSRLVWEILSLKSNVMQESFEKEQIEM